MSTPAQLVPITLEEPIERANGDPITHIELRRPKAGELRGLKVDDLYGCDVNALIQLLPRISTPSLLPEHVEQLGPVDLMEVAGAVRGFFLSAEMKEALARHVGATTGDPSTG